MNKTEYYFLDIMKFIMAIFVVGIHANAFMNAKIPIWLEFIESMAVPFFFLASGFLLECKLNNYSGSNNRFYINYVFKYLKIYLLWTIIYLPISIFNYTINNTSWEIDLYNFINDTIFVGQTGAWPLWYLHSLVISVATIMLLRQKLSLIYIWIIGLFLMFVDYYIVTALSKGMAYITTGMVLYHAICRERERERERERLCLPVQSYLKQYFA